MTTDYEKIATLVAGMVHKAGTPQVVEKLEAVFAKVDPLLLS